MAEQGEIAQYDLPVLTSRRGIIQGILALTAIYVILYVATGSDRFIDGTIIALMAVLFLVATPTFLSLNNPATHIAVLAPLAAPLFFAAAAADSTTSAMAFAMLGVDLLFLGFLFLQPGKLELNIRGIKRRRLITSDFSFDEISGVKEFESRFGKHLRHIGFGSANVELLLFSWRRVPLNVAAADVEEIVERVSRNIDPAVQYDLFFLPPNEKLAASGEPVEQEVKPLRRRGKKAKRLKGQQQEAPPTPTAVR